MADHKLAASVCDTLPNGIPGGHGHHARARGHRHHSDAHTYGHQPPAQPNRIPVLELAKVDDSEDRRYRNGQLRTTSGKPVVVTVGGHFRALVMPVRDPISDGDRRQK